MTVPEHPAFGGAETARIGAVGVQKNQCCLRGKTYFSFIFLQDSAVSLTLYAVSRAVQLYLYKLMKEG